MATVLLVLAARALRTGRTIRMSANAVTIAPVQRAVFRDFIPLRGRVVPRDIVYLDAQEGGRVERVLVEAGDTVTAGQALLEFGNTELQLQVIEREVRIIEQINNLRSTERSLEQDRETNLRALAEIQFNLTRLGRLTERRDSLASRGAVPVAEREDAADELSYYHSLHPIITQSSARQEDWRLRRTPEIRDELAKLQQNLSIVRGKLDNLIVRAPVSGRLTDLDLKVGENCERGKRLAQITPDTGFKLSADVDEFYLLRVRKGQRADMEFAAETVPVKVSRVYPQVKQGQFTIDLAFESAAPAGLAPGEASQGRLRLGEDVSATVIPAGAFLEQTGGDWLFVVAPDGQSARRRRIRLGRRNAEQLEVLAGLSPGERVVVSDYRGLEHLDGIELTH
ncbi:MAG: HlyD family efflux transporter periplasmic adaptor subunit [Proteobacteria bacterium]|nr:HlyD family efflux transporter periplasmic adaptor subunit [Pseudomonadota bacterium]